MLLKYLLVGLILGGAVYATMAGIIWLFGTMGDPKFGYVVIAQHWDEVWVPLASAIVPLSVAVPFSLWIIKREEAPAKPVRAKFTFWRIFVAVMILGAAAYLVFG